MSGPSAKLQATLLAGSQSQQWARACTEWDVEYLQIDSTAKCASGVSTGGNKTRAELKNRITGSTFVCGKGASKHINPEFHKLMENFESQFKEPAKRDRPRKVLVDWMCSKRYISREVANNASIDGIKIANITQEQSDAVDALRRAMWRQWEVDGLELASLMKNLVVSSPNVGLQRSPAHAHEVESNSPPSSPAPARRRSKSPGGGVASSNIHRKKSRSPARGERTASKSRSPSPAGGILKSTRFDDDHVSYASPDMMEDYGPKIPLTIKEKGIHPFWGITQLVLKRALKMGVIDDGEYSVYTTLLKKHESYMTEAEKNDLILLAELLSENNIY